MDREKLIGLLESYREGRIEIEEVINSLKSLPFEDLGFALIDSHRAIRKGYPEVVYCKGKSIDQITEILQKMADGHSTILATKADRNIYESVKKTIPGSQFNETSGMILIGRRGEIITESSVLIVTAGTSDIPVAEEAAFTAETMGNNVERLYDAGVAGIHRLFGNVKKVFDAGVIVVVAGMDGALPSIIGGITDRPVIAVPTSTGYGSSFGGLSALLTMLNTCSPGVVTVNIDNGFGAGYFAGMINRQTARP
ncbi:MAG: nickel pincer cofactor biosynthesis protein LarB [Spirochaetes bacterium]|nr:nickel pincer cofactor biosynthesis protein LarB [Spirochaetota bacterium]